MSIGRRGRNRTRGRQINNLPSVPAHKPYETRDSPRWAVPELARPALRVGLGKTDSAYTGDHHALHRTLSRRSSLSEIAGHTRALGSGGWIRTNFERFRAAGPAVRRPRKMEL